MTDRSDEGRHQAGAGPHWEESFAFDFAASDGSVGGYVRLGFRPAERVAWYWAAFVSTSSGRAGRGHPHPALVLVRDHDVPLPRGRTLEVRTSGLWADHTCETPLEHWTVGVEAFGVALDDPREAFRGERGDLCPLGFDLEWEATEPARPGDEQGYDQGYDQGYGQACTVHGEVLVGTERLELDGVGWRCHRWGNRDWWAPGSGSGGDHPPAASGRTWAGGHFDAGAAFATTDVEVVTDDGLVVSAAIPGLALRAEPIAHAPVGLPRADGTAGRLDRALCRYASTDGRRAVGWIEHLTSPPAPAP